MVKKILICTVLLALVAAVIMATFVIKNNGDTEDNDEKIFISNIESLRLTYSEGYAMNAYITYELDCKDDNKARIKLYGVPEEDAVEVTVSDETVKEIEDILNKYNVGSWDGFKKSDRNVLDGDSFSFKLVFDNGKDIYATGYMKYPKNYNEVEYELDNIFKNLVVE